MNELLTILDEIERINREFAAAIKQTRENINNIEKGGNNG